MKLPKNPHSVEAYTMHIITPLNIGYSYCLMH